MKDNCNNTVSWPPACPKSCPCPVLLNIAESIAREEDALACILNAECAKVNKAVSATGDPEVLIAIDTSLQATLEQITALEGVLQAKLDGIIPLLTDCR